jgi:hypothetical protein
VLYAAKEITNRQPQQVNQMTDPIEIEKKYERDQQHLPVNQTNPTQTRQNNNAHTT